MNSRRVVALVGLSGVGKSTVLAGVRGSVAFEHLRASALIKAERERRKQAAVDYDALREADRLRNVNAGSRVCHVSTRSATKHRPGGGNDNLISTRIVPIDCHETASPAPPY